MRPWRAGYIALRTVAWSLVLLEISLHFRVQLRRNVVYWEIPRVHCDAFSVGNSSEEEKSCEYSEEWDAYKSVCKRNDSAHSEDLADKAEEK